ncbi:hypothetical protein V8J82_03530 [Gymnodinialimonas sp. 2305UL16-5]|uniref:hypothetical protein n=1 Tax=Gymnodinialimonas mytili TaxID=3126503 RepID=UPI0030A936AC
MGRLLRALGSKLINALLYWGVVFVVSYFGTVMAYWLIYLFVSLGGLVGLSDGGWDRPWRGAIGPGLISFAAICATLATLANLRDWWRVDQS